MPSVKPQAISGVSPGAENEIRTEYPSVASTGLGRLFGALYESIPVRIGGLKVSNLLFTVPSVPFVLGLYAWVKVFGRRYVLTNKSVQQWSMFLMGQRLFAQTALSDIAEIEVVQSPGQVFYKAADLLLLGSDGSLLMSLSAIPHADVFRQTILAARDAQASVAASLATIEARHAS